MITIYTSNGKQVEVILQSELCDPLNMGEYVRAYCHIHGSDHQRSLSINKATGWGHCFNAACDATVLVAEWNPQLATRLLHSHYRGLQSSSIPDYEAPTHRPRRPIMYQPMLIPPPKSIPQWQQDELEALLELDEEMRRALVRSQRARAYLRERGIPLDTAFSTGVCYLPATLLNEMPEKRSLLRRWEERILFPLVSPDGKGYIGRSLWGWRPGMDEKRHKGLLDRAKTPRRWIKTGPAGWFGEDLDSLPETIIVVEGAFDRLTLLAAGFSAHEVVALAGTAMQAEWLPARTKTVVLALDGDEGGQDATGRLADRLARAGLRVQICSLREDHWGKDWNERWQHLGKRGVNSIFQALEAAHPA